MRDQSSYRDFQFGVVVFSNVTTCRYCQKTIVCIGWERFTHIYIYSHTWFYVTFLHPTYTGWSECYVKLENNNDVNNITQSHKCVDRNGVGILWVTIFSAPRVRLNASFRSPYILDKRRVSDERRVSNSHLSMKYNNALLVHVYFVMYIYEWLMRNKVPPKRYSETTETDSNIIRKSSKTGSRC